MSGLWLLLHAGLRGAFTLVGLALGFYMVMMIRDLRGWLKDDLSWRRRTWATIRLTPKHIYNQTDWRQFAKAMAVVEITGFVIGVVLLVFYVGLVEVIG